MKRILTAVLVIIGLNAGAQIISISPAQAYQGDSLQTTITSSGLFLTNSSPQGNIQNIILKNATDSVFALSDSTNVVNTNTATTFWEIPSTIATGIYTLVVRVYNTLFSGPTTDYTLPGSFTITSPVWPGDADNNKLVDNNDLLPIGLGYGSTGATRPNASIIWHPQSCIDWLQVFTTYAPLVNYKNADCNGDGLINAIDTAAIMQNFSLTHNKTNYQGGSRSGIPTIIPEFDKEVLYNGDTLTVTFTLGDTAYPAKYIYGIAFTFNYDPIIVDTSFTHVTFGPSWFGNATDKINISKIFNDGQIKIALTRIDHTTRSGSGGLGACSFKITTDNISGQIDWSSYTNIGYITDVNIIDSAGNTIPVNAGSDSAHIYRYPLGIAAIEDASISVAPNPADGRVNISADDMINEITITNISGQQLWHSESIQSRKKTIDISTYADGLYFVQVRTVRGVRTVKLLVTK